MLPDAAKNVCDQPSITNYYRHSLERGNHSDLFSYLCTVFLYFSCATHCYMAVSERLQEKYFADNFPGMLLYFTKIGFND